MKIHELLTIEVRSINPESSIREAADLMDEVDAGSLPVVDGEQLLGMITDRDIVIRAISAGLDPNTTTVRDAMTSPVDYCYRDQSVEEVAELMKERQIRRIPVVDRNHKLVGIVSLGDLAQESVDPGLVADVTRRVTEDAPQAALQAAPLADVRRLRAVESFSSKVRATQLPLSLAVVGLGAAIGAGLMYLLDPDRGRRRRALVRDQAVHLGKRVRRLSHQKSHHLANRAHGLLHQTGLASGGVRS